MRILGTLLAGLCVLLSPALAAAQEFPTRAIRLIVPGDTLADRWVSNVNSIVVGTPVGTQS